MLYIYSNISKFHTSFLEQPKEKNDSNIKSPLMTSNNRKKFGNTPTSSKSRLNSYKSQEQPVSRSIASVPESKANHRYIDRHNNNQQQQQNQSIQSGSRDEHSYKQIPKRLITTINKPISLRERVNTKRQQQDKRDETSVENASTNRTNAVRSYGKPGKILIK